MKETRVLVVTLMYRFYGPAIASWLEAFRYAEANMIADRVRFDHLMLYGNPLFVGDNSQLAVTHKYNEARAAFLAGDYWAMITVEDDMIIPRNSFKRLVDMFPGFGCDVAMGLYAFRHGRPKLNAALEIYDMSAIYLNDRPDEFRASWGNIRRVEGVGLGLTAIKRPVMERLAFHKSGGADCDWYFALDCKENGFDVMVDTSLRAGHYSPIPSPRVLWPDIDAPSGVRVEFK